MTRTALYRHFDATGRLLYVGISRDPVTRLAHHRCKSPWFHSIATTTLEWFSTRDEADLAERETIRTERPLHNKLHGFTAAEGTVDELFSAIGRDKIRGATGFGPQVLSRAAIANVMPSGWYPAIRALCLEEGVPCPEYLFRWAPAKNLSDEPAQGSAA